MQTVKETEKSNWERGPELYPGTERLLTSPALTWTVGSYDHLQAVEGNEWADVCLGLEHNPSSIYGRIRALRGTGSARMNRAIQDSGEMRETNNHR